MEQCMTQERLELETELYEDSGATSTHCRPFGFRPAFYDTDSRTIHLSRFADGRLAPIHLLDGLPDNVVISRDATGRIEAVLETIVSGFEMYGRFYTRDEVSSMLACRH